MNDLIIKKRIIYHLSLIQDQPSQPVDVKSFTLMLEVASGSEMRTTQDVDSAFFELCEKRQALGLSFVELTNYIKYGVH